MRDPKRLFQGESDSLGAQLLRSGRTDVPDRRRADRIVAGLVGAGGGLVSGKAGATALSLWSIAQWFAAGAIGGVVATSALFAFELPARSVAATAATTHVATEAPAKTVALPGTAGPLAASAPPVEPREPPKPTLPRPLKAARAEKLDVVPTSDSAPPTAAQSTLGAEAATLASAKAALDRKAPAEALATLRAYRARFPRGELAQDATYLEMEAALASGNRNAARGIAATLASGTTPSADRAREILKGEHP